MIVKIFFWIFLFIIFYTYVGYTLLLLLFTGMKKLLRRSDNRTSGDHLPEVTLLVPAFNEGDCIASKISNSFDLNYPAEKLRFLWVIDGSTDQSAEILRPYSRIKVLYEKERRGKIHAMNRGMTVVDTPLVIFTDANTMLNRDAVLEMVRLFGDENTGCVTGEKRISRSGMQKAVDAGEGIYWQYESWIKKLESGTGSVMGAVGELFAIRTGLYSPVREDTLLDDFTISMQILQKGYRVGYTPKAWGTETASLNITEEIKRKTRIAAGGIQALTRMSGLLNPFRHGLVSLMFVSHKVLRWTLVPIGLPLIFLLNLCIVAFTGHAPVYSVLLVIQCTFYLFILAGRMLHNVRLRTRVLFVPYYLFIMNYAVIKGFMQYITGQHTVNWQKVRRS
jgi:cellulose synthase/poly-beta-1,6-N-acetylglucosamine synthase-like glycosyltransferase